ncbi:MAG: ABC transporter ATP-binding protein [Actinomycetia bacterium]|nr:ABC transporter ATP-binding protein [Actinomycetes bacterium]
MPGPSGTNSTEPAIRLTDVRKSFGDIAAVDGLSLTVPTGVCFGLLGPNGAGKSTTMRLLTGQGIADSGSIEILGLPIPQESKRARAAMGVVPQQEWVEEDLTCAQTIHVWATLLRVPRPDREAAVARGLEIAGLADRANDKVKTLSGGMKRRILIARSLVHDPQLVLLDEPTVGLDPQVRQELWGLIDRLRNSGVTVLMSTHYIEEAERLSDVVAVMREGKVVAQGTPAQLRSKHVGESALEVFGSPERLDAAQSGAQAAGLPTRRSGLSLSILRAESAPAALTEDLGDTMGRAANLEDVFVLLTGDEIE